MTHYETLTRSREILAEHFSTMAPGQGFRYAELHLLLAKQEIILTAKSLATLMDSFASKGTIVRLNRRLFCTPFPIPEPPAAVPTGLEFKQMLADFRARLDVVEAHVDRLERELGVPHELVTTGQPE